MYLIETLAGEDLGKLPPWVFNQEEIQEASKVEVYGSNFQDPGPDFCRFVLTKKDGTIVAKVQEGY